jgi:hypothetical protein
MMSEGPPRSKGNAAYLIAMAILVVVVGVAVAVFGVVRPPALASMSSAGFTPPAAVAGVMWNDHDQCTEIAVVKPDGSRHAVTCGDVLGDLVGWTDRGIALSSWEASKPAILYVDPRSGNDLSTEPAPGDGGPLVAAGVRTEARDGTLTVRAESDGTVLWTVHAAEDYRIQTGSRSPDGAWFALVDSVGRLLIVPADGSAPPAVWSKNAGFSTFPGPMWEGTPVQWDTVKGE